MVVPDDDGGQRRYDDHKDRRDADMQTNPNDVASTIFDCNSMTG